MNTEDFLNKSTLFADNLPEPLKNTLQQFRNHANKEGILLLKNLPVESQLPATPTDNHKSSYTSESLLATIG
ncbi:MAG: hypothetical protein KAR30_04155, partial [Gammaproteobacteria bacterium]|nr:hypothetical protein [Gammaproteobacteria bacterium]